MYYINKKLRLSFSDAEKKVRDELQKEGFGILTEIDVKEKFREKLNIEFRQYKILGACNPPYAYKALNAEDKIGTMLPCNVIIQESGDNEVEVAAIDPLTSMKAVNNDKLMEIAGEIRNKLEKVISLL